MNETRQGLCNQTDEISLEKAIKIPEAYRKGLVKCRVLYGEKIHRVEFRPYALPSIRSLHIIRDDAMHYTYKSADRSAIESRFNLRGKADDILIVKNGCITDTSFCNVLLRKNNAYFTPDTFLLNGVKRQHLLSEGRIKERRIMVDDLKDFDSIYLINAMIDIEDGVQVAMEMVG